MASINNQPDSKPKNLVMTDTNMEAIADTVMIMMIIDAGDLFNQGNILSGSPDLWIMPITMMTVVNSPMMQYAATVYKMFRKVGSPDDDSRLGTNTIRIDTGIA